MKQERSGHTLAAPRALRSKLIRWSLCAVAAGLAPASWAQSNTPVIYGAAAITGLSIRVVDLDLYDGIDATYRFLPSPEGVTGFSSSNMQVTHLGQETWLSSGEAAVNFMQFPGFQGQVDGVTGVVAPLSNGVAVAASASGQGTSFFVAGLSQTLYYGYLAHSLWIAPHTQIDISINATTFAAATGICSFDDADDCGYVRSTAFLQGSTMTSGDLPFATLVSEANYGGQSTALANGLLTISLTNFSDLADRAYLHADAQVHGVTPVPEPSTYALMLVGMLALGGAYRRKLARA